MRVGLYMRGPGGAWVIKVLGPVGVGHAYCNAHKREATR